MLKAHPDFLCAPFAEDSCLETAGLEMVQDSFPADFSSDDLLPGVEGDSGAI